MNKNNTPIVVVAFNRPKSLERILSSIAGANYLEKSIDLIISIDRAANNQDVLDVANAFQWKNGNKIVKYAEKNLGLRKHIIACASYALDYGSVIILEDDLYVSPCFYSYTEQALAFSADKDYVGGISLYNHRKNVHTGRNFEPTNDPYDTWYFQFASSWGQAWTKSQIQAFLEWYEKNPDLNTISAIPNNVLSWSDKSWLKYFIGFLIEKNMYFIYPKVSLSTNFSDAGTHMGADSTSYQVPLIQAHDKKFHFGELRESRCVYDAFFENRLLPKHLGINTELLCVDLYGYQKSCKKHYWLTTQVLDYKPVKKFALSLKPMDDNILSNMNGNEIYLYDTRIAEKNVNSRNRFGEIIYQIKHLSHQDSGYLFWKLTVLRIKSLWKRITG